MNAPLLSLLCRLLSLGAFLSFVGPASADSSWFTRDWQTDDGLPNNYVNAVVQGADGYLWIGTPEALAKFDGSHFIKIPDISTNGNQLFTIRHGEPVTLTPPVVYLEVEALSVGRDGGLWLAMQRDRVMEVNSPFSSAIGTEKPLPGNSPSAVVEDTNGTVWIAYAHFFAHAQDGKIEPLGADEGLPGGNLAYSGVVKDSSGNVWVAKGKRLGIIRQGHFQPVVTANYPGNVAQVARVAAARTNGIWMALGEHLFRCGSDGNVMDLGTFQTETHRTEASTLLEDHTGAVWIGTDNNGLFRYSQGNFEKVETSQPTILSLAEDDEGNIWAGTAGGGLDRISRSAVQLENFNNGTSLTPFQSVCEGVPGTFWGVTGDGQLLCRQDGQWRPMEISQVNSEDVTCVAADTNGTVWFGTRDRLLHCWIHNHLTTWTTKTGFLSHTVVALLLASNGDVWVGEYGTPNVIQYLHEGTLHTLDFPKEWRTPSRITCLAEDAQGNIWVGTVSGRLFRTAGDQLIDQTRLLPHGGESILSLYGTPDGAMWIGFEGFGLGRLKNGQFAQIGSARGLDDDIISQIVGDNEGWLWFGSEHGIFKVHQRELENALTDPATRIRPIRYGRNEGLASVEANSADTYPYVYPEAIRGSDGKLRMPLRRALAVIDPSALNNDCQQLPVLVTQVTMDGQIIASSDTLTTNVTESRVAAGPLRLSPGHRHLEFSFTAINFSTPENIHFRYRLDGFDNQWIEAAETERTADYTRLPAGNYQFEVQACNGDGPWNKSSEPLALIVPAFFWETWWFRSLSLIVLMSFVVVIARYISFRRLQERLSILQQQRALDQERARIAKDLHDDLGGSLTEVGLLVKMLDHYQHQPQKVSGAVQQIASTVRQVNESLDQIVWAINPRNDTLPHLIGFLGQSSMDFLRSAGIKCEMDLPDHPPKCILTPEERHHLFLTVKEAINNIVRHAQASEVQIRVSAENHFLKINIQDNGRGMNGDPERYGSNGLRNMRQRMEAIGGQCLVETAPDKGTRVSLTFPIPSTESDAIRSEQ